MAVVLLYVALFALSAAAHAGELLVLVTDVLGHRLENIAVSIEPAGDPKDQKKARPSKPSLIRRTDKLGCFRFVRIRPGKYFVRANARANRGRRLQYLKTEVQIDYPANVESHSVEITLRSVRRHKVSGRVLGVKGLPYQQLVIFFEPEAYPGDAAPLFSRMAAFAGNDGRFEIYVPGGRYGLRLGTVDRGMFEEIASTLGTLDVSQDQEGLLLDRFQVLTDP